MLDLLRLGKKIVGLWWPLGEVTSPQSLVIGLCLGSNDVVTTHLRVAFGPQDLGVTGICGVDLHMGRCLHGGAVEFGIGDLAQPAKVDQVKGRPLTRGGAVVTLSNTLGIGTRIELVGHAIATVILVRLR